MQTAEPKVTTLEEALAEFKKADALYKSAIAEVQHFRYEHPSMTKTLAFASLQAKCDELGRDRNTKLNIWSNLKPCTDTFTTPPDTKPICTRCGSAALMILMNGAWRCNACGSSVGER